MSFGVFESAYVDDSQNDKKKKLAQTRLAQAVSAVDRAVGVYLKKSTSKSDFQDRIQLAADDIRSIVSRYLEGETGFQAVVAKLEPHYLKKTASEYLDPGDLDDNGAQNFFEQYADSAGIDTYGGDYDRIWGDIKESVDYDIVSDDIDTAVQNGELSSSVGSRLQWDLEDFHGLGSGARFSSKRTAGGYIEFDDFNDRGLQSFLEEYADFAGFDTSRGYDQVWEEVKRAFDFEDLSGDIDSAVQNEQISPMMGSRLSSDLEDFHGLGGGARFSSKRTVSRGPTVSEEEAAELFYQRLGPDFYLEDLSDPNLPLEMKVELDKVADEVGREIGVTRDDIWEAVELNPPRTSSKKTANDPFAKLTPEQRELAFEEARIDEIDPVADPEGAQQYLWEIGMMDDDGNWQGEAGYDDVAGSRYASKKTADNLRDSWTDYIGDMWFDTDKDGYLSKEEIGKAHADWSRQNNLNEVEHQTSFDDVMDLYDSNYRTYYAPEGTPASAERLRSQSASKKTSATYDDDGVEGFLQFIKDRGYSMPKDLGEPSSDNMQDEVWSFTKGDPGRMKEITRGLEDEWDYLRTSKLGRTSRRKKTSNDAWKYDTNFQHALIELYGTTDINDEMLIDALIAYAGIGAQQQVDLGEEAPPLEHVSHRMRRADRYRGPGSYDKILNPTENYFTQPVRDGGSPFEEHPDYQGWVDRRKEMGLEPDDLYFDDEEKKNWQKFRDTIYEEHPYHPNNLTEKQRGQLWGEGPGGNPSKGFKLDGPSGSYNNFDYSIGEDGSTEISQGPTTLTQIQFDSPEQGQGFVTDFFEKGYSDNPEFDPNSPEFEDFDHDSFYDKMKSKYSRLSSRKSSHTRNRMKKAR